MSGRIAQRCRPLGFLLLFLAVSLGREERARAGKHSYVFERKPVFIIGDRAAAVALQPDGKLVVAGESDREFVLVRYQPDGTLDATFGVEGAVRTSLGTDGASALALQADGKVVVIGKVYQPYTGIDYGVLRYNPDGSLDEGFGTNGLATTDFPIPDSASTDSPSGDATGGYGRRTTEPQKPPSVLGPSYDEPFAVAIQPDGKIVVGGTSGLARYNTDGSLDENFGTAGRLRIDVGHFVLQKDGKIVMVVPQRTFMLTRYNQDGSRDASFGTSGSVTTQIGSVSTAGDVAVQADGKLVVAGTSYDGHKIGFALARYTPDGALDGSFGRSGTIVSDLSAVFPPQFFHAEDLQGARWKVMLQAEGKIVVAGTPWHLLVGRGLLLARYTRDGQVDSGFGRGGHVTVTIKRAEGFFRALALQPDGKIVVAGGAENGMMVRRYRSDGKLDPTFGKGGKVTTRLGAGYTIG